MPFSLLRLKKDKKEAQIKDHQTQLFNGEYNLVGQSARL